MSNEITEYDDYEEVNLPAEESNAPEDGNNGGYDVAPGASMLDMVQSAERTLDAAANIAGMFTECVKAEQRTKQIEAWGKVEMARTIAKFKTAQDFMEKTFGERDKALGKHYELLDKAVASGDRDLILASLHGISSIVTKSPLDDFNKFVDLYNDTSQTLLDF